VPAAIPLRAPRPPRNRSRSFPPKRPPAQSGGLFLSHDKSVTSPPAGDGMALRKPWTFVSPFTF
jgi:hypothetical protein